MRMNSYGDGNVYRGMVCRDSEVPTYYVLTGYLPGPSEDKAEKRTIMTVDNTTQGDRP